MYQAQLIGVATMVILSTVVEEGDLPILTWIIPGHIALSGIVYSCWGEMPIQTWMIPGLTARAQKAMMEFVVHEVRSI